MAIADKLAQLNNVKLAIKNALINKGIDMTGVPFTDYASKVNDKNYIYKNGDEYTNLTGGWKVGVTEGSSTAKKDTTSLYVSGNYAYYGAYFQTVNKIDLTDYNFIILKKTSQGYANFGLDTDEATNNENIYATILSSFNGNYAFLDVSSVTGSYYVRGYIRNNESDTVSNLRASEIWLAKSI